MFSLQFPLPSIETRLSPYKSKPASLILNDQSRSISITSIKNPQISPTLCLPKPSVLSSATELVVEEVVEGANGSRVSDARVGSEEKWALPAGLRREFIPNHVAVIMDGNVRWARQRGLPSSSGHQAGIRSLRELVELCCKWGVRVLTVFAFSSDNWIRPQMEVNFLMSLFQRGLEDELENFMRASDYPREKDGACLQMRLSYSPAAHLFLFLVQWSDCNFAGALGFLRIHIYKAYVDGKTTMSIQEKKASIREFYTVIFPSLLQLERGITDVEDQKQKEICAMKYKKMVEMDKSKMSEIDVEREEECGICMEINFKVVLPNCNHSLCMKCYHDWHSRSKSCPFCRDSLQRVNSSDLWIYTDDREILNMSSICKENLKRLFMYVDKLPSIHPDPPVFFPYDSLIM